METVRAENLGKSYGSGETAVHALRPASFTIREGELAVYRRRKLGFIFQAFNLVPELDVEENIELPLLLDRRRPDPDSVGELIGLLGLGERRHHLPGQLSGGQQHRGAIGRALITRPAIVLADEPTGNLDSSSSAEVMRLLRRAVDGGQTLVMITHNVELAAYADRVLAVRDGAVSELSGRQR